MAKKLMNPSDYPMFGFRCFNSDHKARLDALVDKLLKARGRGSDRAIKKNEVIAEALEFGLEAKIKEALKKP